MRACLRAAHSSMRSLGIPSATALAMPPTSSISLMNCSEENTHFKLKFTTHAVHFQYFRFHSISFTFYKPLRLCCRRHPWEFPSCVSPPRDQRPSGCPTLPGWWSGCSWRCERSSLWASPELRQMSWCGATGCPRTQPPWLQSQSGSHYCKGPRKKEPYGKTVIILQVWFFKSFDISYFILKK